MCQEGPERYHWRRKLHCLLEHQDLARGFGPSSAKELQPMWRGQLESLSDISLPNRAVKLAKHEFPENDNNIV